MVWNGTQFNTRRERNEYGIPKLPGATLAVIGDAKRMSSDYIRSAYYEKYGVSLFVGIGIPIPVLDENMAKHLSISNEQIETTILDYGQEHHPAVGTTSYAKLASGSVTLPDGKVVKTAPLSSLAKAREIAELLGQWIREKRFFLTEPVQMLPKDSFVKPLVPREGGEQ